MLRADGLAVARPLPVVQGLGDGDGGEEGVAGVAHPAAAPHRWVAAVAAAVLPLGPAQGVGRLVGAREVGPRAPLVAPGVAVDQARVALLQALEVEAEAGRRARAPVRRQHVRPVEQPVEDLDPLGVLEVHRDRPLAAVGAEPHVGAGPERVVQGVHLDDVGAEVGEQLGVEGPGHAEAEVEHPDPGERPRGPGSDPPSADAAARADAGSAAASARTASVCSPRRGAGPATTAGVSPNSSTGRGGGCARGRGGRPRPRSRRPAAPGRSAPRPGCARAPRPSRSGRRCRPTRRTGTCGTPRPAWGAGSCRRGGPRGPCPGDRGRRGSCARGRGRPACRPPTPSSPSSAARPSGGPTGRRRTRRGPRSSAGRSATSSRAGRRGARRAASSGPRPPARPGAATSRPTGHDPSPPGPAAPRVTPSEARKAAARLGQVERGNTGPRGRRPAPSPRAGRTPGSGPGRPRM